LYGQIWRDKIDAYRYWWRLLGKLRVYAADKGKFEKCVVIFLEGGGLFWRRERGRKM